MSIQGSLTIPMSESRLLCVMKQRDMIYATSKRAMVSEKEMKDELIDSNMPR